MASDLAGEFHNVAEDLGLLESNKVDELLADCDTLSHKITNFSRALSLR